MHVIESKNRYSGRVAAHRSSSVWLATKQLRLVAGREVPDLVAVRVCRVSTAGPQPLLGSGEIPAERLAVGTGLLPGNPVDGMVRFLCHPVGVPYTHTGTGTHLGVVLEAVLLLLRGCFVNRDAEGRERNPPSAQVNDVPFRNLNQVRTEETFFNDAVAVGIVSKAPFLAGEARDGVAGSCAIEVADYHTRAGASTHTGIATLAEAQALVGVAIAVIVDVVAELGAGGPGLRITDGVVLVAADQDSLCCAGSNADGAGLVEARHVVDLAVAVVVDVIAELGVAIPGESTTGGALLVAGAGGHCFPKAGPNPNRAWLCQVEVFVGAAIAVVIVPITPFWCGRDDIVHDALGVASSSASYDALASAHIVAEARHPDVEVLVDVAIAVVVDVVAGLGAGGAGISCAHGEVFPLCAGEPAGAGADANPYLTITVEVEVLVGVAIAVVVLVIADLGAGDARICVALRLDAVAHLLPIAGAGAYTLGAGIAEVEVLVGAAIAVVVGAVAQLGAGGPGLAIADDFAAERSANALSSPGASTNPHGASAGTGELVGAAIAVVVDVVADLCLRKDFSLASRPVALGVAGLLTHATRADVGRTICSCVAGLGSPFNTVAVDAFVDTTIAVVIDAVTHLEGEFPTTLTGVEESLVGVTVAVVVLVVADLGDAIVPLVFHAEVCRGQNLGVIGGDSVVHLHTGVNIALLTLLLCVAGFPGISTFPTTVVVGNALVGVAVAVVVIAVADLALGAIEGAVNTPISLSTDICVGSPAITLASVGGGHIRGHRVGPAVAGVGAVGQGTVAPSRTTLANISATLDADVGREILDAAREAASEDVEENEDGPRTSSTTVVRGHFFGFGDSPPFWAVVIAVTSAHCVFVFSFYKPQK